MSNFLAIATATATLRHILQGAVGTDVPGADVKAGRPDSIGTGTPPTQVNIYLYQVTPNAAWRNADLPTRRSEGQLVQRPQVALDLHYLLSFYGNEEQLEPQRLLGSVVRTLHTRPVLTRQMIEGTLKEPTLAFLAKPNSLADQVELVKFTPLSLSLEELSKLWSVFFQVPYTLSVAYQGTVVLIESEDTPQQALPVRARKVYVITFRQPVIEQILSQEKAGDPIVADRPILAGYNLVIVGKQLRGEDTQMSVGGIKVTPANENVSETQIILPLPAALLAGVQGVQVIHRMLMGEPPTPHRGVESNVAAFVLRPQIVEPVGLANPQGTGNNPRSANVNLTIRPVIGDAQRAILLLNEFKLPSGSPPETTESTALAYSFSVFSKQQLSPPASPPETTSSITFAISGVRAGTYLVRVQVDGAESPLTVDTNPASPTFNQYIGPKVTIP